METTTKPVRFRSMCPKCAKIQPQSGYDRNSLLRLLNGGYPVEAYCAACDEYWPISFKERVALGAAAIKEKGACDRGKIHSMEVTRGVIARESPWRVK